MTKFIYGLFELDTGTLRYIGQTAFPRERYRQHSSGGVISTRIWMLRLKQEKRGHYMRVLATPRAETADLSETDHIRDALLRGEKLLNREILW